MSAVEPIDPRSPHVVVVGGGISGLSAAWTLLRPDRMRNPDSRAVKPKVTVLEADSRMGGKIRTSRFADLEIDEGADSFLGRTPHALRLCNELGIGNELVSPASREAFIWSRGHMHRLPSKNVLGVPGGLGVLARSGIISPPGVARAAADLVLPAIVGYSSEDPTVAEVVGKRLGREVVDRLVDPLLAGIHAGSVDRLSLAASAPQLSDMGDANPSLLKAAGQYLRRREQAEGRRPVFYAPLRGMSFLIDTLTASLAEQGAILRTSAPLNGMQLLPDGRWLLEVGHGENMIADALLLATPAHTTAALLKEVCPDSTTPLTSIPYASVAVLRLAYNVANLERPLKGTGYLVPAVDGRLVTACSWLSSKWEHQRAPGQVVLRASVGRINDSRADHLSDSELGEAVHTELKEAMGLKRRPFAASITRWQESFPQYESGHTARVLQIERAVGALPGIALAGAAYHGLGIPSCIKTAGEAAEELLAQLHSRI